MAVIRPVRSQRTMLADAPSVSASVAKNSFGRILDRVARDGRVAITKHDEPCAVLISVEEYRALVGAEESTLNTLADEFDALYHRMQQPGARAAMQRAFALTPRQLGRAAINEAAATATGGPGLAARGTRPQAAVNATAVSKGARRARG